MFATPDGVAVNNSNQIVGYDCNASNLIYHAYLYNNSTNIVDLGNLGESGGGSVKGTDALAINSKGYVVGYSVTSGTAQHAFLWTPTSNNGTTGSMQDLNNLLLNAGAIPAGYYLYEATGINSAGSICGYLSNSAQTQFQAFALIATLPGDANLDGKVDINDLTTVLSNFGRTGLANAWTSGDFNGDGKVDINDLTTVSANFGRSDGSSVAGVAAVPEPWRAGIARRRRCRPRLAGRGQLWPDRRQRRGRVPDEEHITGDADSTDADQHQGRWFRHGLDAGCGRSGAGRSATGQLSGR